MAVLFLHNFKENPMSNQQSAMSNAFQTFFAEAPQHAQA